MRPNFIIVDGPDGTGKSTLCEALHKEIPNSVVKHVKGAWFDKMHIYHRSVIKWAENQLNDGKTVILDRFWPSELIYSNVYRSGPSKKYTKENFIQRCLNNGAFYIIANNDPVIVGENFAKLKEERKELYDGKMEQVSREYWGLADFMEKQGLSGIVYDRTKWDNKVDDFVSFLLNEVIPN